MPHSMKKRDERKLILLIIPVILSLFLIQGVNAEEIYDQWVIAGGNATFDNYTITLNYAFNTHNLLTEFQGEKWLMNNGTCKSTGLYQLCLCLEWSY